MSDNVGLTTAIRGMVEVAATIEIIARLAERYAIAAVAEGDITHVPQSTIVADSYPVLAALAWALVEPEQVRALLAEVFTEPDYLTSLSEEWQHVFKEVRASTDASWAELLTN